MIEIFKKSEISLKKIDTYENNSWVNIVHPSEEEINSIIEKFDIPRDFLTDSLDIDEVARLEIDESKEDILEDVMIDIKQAIEMAEIYSIIMKEMMSFFSSLISNNLNVVMKFLTAVTIIIAIPTLVASIYGMNVSLPFQNAPHAFIITLVISAVAAIMGIILFVYRKWI